MSGQLPVGWKDKLPRFSPQVGRSTPMLVLAMLGKRCRRPQEHSPTLVSAIPLGHACNSSPLGHTINVARVMNFGRRTLGSPLPTRCPGPRDDAHGSPKACGAFSRMGFSAWRMAERRGRDASETCHSDSVPKDEGAPAFQPHKTGMGFARVSRREACPCAYCTGFRTPMDGPTSPSRQLERYLRSYSANCNNAESFWSTVTYALHECHVCIHDCTMGRLHGGMIVSRCSTPW